MTILKLMFEARDLETKKVAEELKINHFHLSRILSGSAKASFEDAIKLRTYLNLKNSEIEKVFDEIEKEKLENFIKELLS